MIMIAPKVEPRRPAVAFHVIVWHGDVPVDQRTPATLSYGAMFRDPADAILFRRRVEDQGGAVAGLVAVPRPRMWFDSIDDYLAIGDMTAEELVELRRYWAEACEAPASSVQFVAFE